MTETLDFEWVAELPPAPARGRPSSFWAESLTPLQAAPGRWALVQRISAEHRVRLYSTARKIRKGLQVDIAEGEYEARALPVPDTDPAEYGLYVRYVGEAES